MTTTTTRAPRASGSVDAHYAVTNTTVAVMSYNVGIMNTQIMGSHWAPKYELLRDDIKSIFAHEVGVQALLLSEFGNMLHPMKTSSTNEVFQELLNDLELPHIEIKAAPPYVALIDTNCWRVSKHQLLHNMCSKAELKIQHLILEHVDSLETLRCFNAHIPTKFGTPQRKEDCVKNMCEIASPSTGVTQPGAVMPWLICGDLNIDIGTMSRWCQAFVEPGTGCISTSQRPIDMDAQKSDHALSQGIALVPVQSWVGWHSKPCASDAHDAVLVTGVLQCMQKKTVFTKAPPLESVWSFIDDPSSSSSGVSQPTAIVLKDSIPETRPIRVRDVVSIDDHIPQTTLSSTTCDVPQQIGTNAEADAPDNSCVPQPPDSGQRLHQEVAFAPDVSVPVEDAPGTSGLHQPPNTEETPSAHTPNVLEDTFAPTRTEAEKDDPDSSGVRAHTPNILEDTFAPTRTEAEQDDPDSSGVLQPAANRVRPPTLRDVTELESIQEVIEEISQTAMADNGDLKDGDSPDASRYEPPRRRLAAQELLQTLYVDESRNAIRPDSDLLSKLAIPIRVREDMVRRVANYHGVAQPQLSTPRYSAGAFTVQQWLDWYKSEPFSDPDFDWVLATWKEEFPMNKHTREKIEEWRKQNTHESKKKARDLEHGAFSAYLQQECFNTQLAIALVKHPTATLHSLLESWAKYLESPEYLKERARARKVRVSDAEATLEKSRQVELKMKVHRLRHQVRQAKALHRKPHKITSDNRDLYYRWLSGGMTAELEECTRDHGFGKLEATGELLQTSGFSRRHPRELR